MKICQHCGSANSDSKKICSACGGAFAEVVDSQVIEKFFEKEERKEKRTLRFRKAMLALYFILTVPMYVLCVMKDSSFWWELLLCMGIFSLLYYLSVMKPKALFFLEHFMHVDNIDAVEPSEWYYISSRIAGYLMWGVGVGLFCYVMIDLWC